MSLENTEKLWITGAWLREFFECEKQSLPNNLELRKRWNVSDHPVSKATQEYLFRQLEHKDAFRLTRDNLTSRLSSGKLKAIGRVVTVGQKSRLELIPLTFWPTSDVDFFDNKATNNLKRYDRIKVTLRNNEVIRTPIDQPVDHDDPTNPEKHPRHSGAKSFEYYRKQVLLKCLEKNSDFADWSTKNQHKEAVRIARELYEQHGAHEKFGRSSFYKTRNNLIETGEWSSTKVQ